MEKLNGLSINVLGWDDGTLTCGKPDKRHAGFYPIQLSATPNSEDTINLLLLSNDKTSHYVLVKDLSALLCNKSKNTKKKFWCVRCFRGFMTPKLREDHEEDCCNFRAQRVFMPHEAPLKNRHGRRIPTKQERLKLSFSSYRKTVKHPFVISKFLIQIVFLINSTSNSSVLSNDEL